MFATITPLIQTILTGVTELQFISDHPTNDLDGFPAAVFFPASFSNSFMDTSRNFKEYTYKIFLITEMTVRSMDNAWNTVLTGAADSVIQAFDTAWDQGATSEGHPIWWMIETGSWGTIEAQDGNIVYLELDLKIKLANNI